MQTSEQGRAAHANLRVFLSEVWPELRSVPVNARRAVPRMSERPLPVAEVGTWQGEAPARHGRGSDFQGIGILHHRLPKRFVQRGSQEGVSYDLGCWRKVSRPERRRERSFACPNKATTESPGKRNRLTISLGSMGCQLATRWSGLGEPVIFSTLRKSALGKVSLAYENKIRPVLIALLGSEKSPCLKAGNRIEGGGVCR